MEEKWGSLRATQLTQKRKGESQDETRGTQDPILANEQCVLVTRILGEGGKVLRQLVSVSIVDSYQSTCHL